MARGHIVTIISSSPHPILPTLQYAVGTPTGEIFVTSIDTISSVPTLPPASKSVATRSTSTSSRAFSRQHTSRSRQSRKFTVVSYLPSLSSPHSPLSPRLTRLLQSQKFPSATTTFSHLWPLPPTIASMPPPLQSFHLCIRNSRTKNQSSKTRSTP